jgi:hypothetical protein
MGNLLKKRTSQVTVSNICFYQFIVKGFLMQKRNCFFFLDTYVFFLNLFMQHGMSTVLKVFELLANKFLIESPCRKTATSAAL